ncbi:MAG TPA: hypothetical protein VMV91_11300 [Rhodocyclaceae bacterium]|nr:hypothetical protein [Rhodocyclaceae bacterium]
MPIRFDDSLPALARVVLDELGQPALESGVVVRDVTGRLAFFLAHEISQDDVQRISSRVLADVYPYARTDRTFVNSTDFGAAEILNDPSAHKVLVGDYWVRLVDRRLVGADWLRYPSPPAPPPPRFVFASIKGGVGRSTALSIAAADMASRGRRVLAIDIDMEAPGLGAMLLDEGTLPEFGLVDALVENGLCPLDDKFLADLVGPSGLADRRGRIDVIPAFGRRSYRNPGDVLAKIARAYAEDLRPDGTVASTLDQVRELVDLFADPRRYDAILVDARAGLHETTASAILGLGAEILLFGLDEPQTFQGYSVLLAHLARFSRQPNVSSLEWLERVTMVQGKALSNVEDRTAFADKCRAMFRDAGLDGPSDVTADVAYPAAPFKDVPWVDDDEVSDAELLLDDRLRIPEPIAILDDDRFRHFEPSKRRDLLAEQVYRSSYGTFLDRLDEAFHTKSEEQS